MFAPSASACLGPHPLPLSCSYTILMLTTSAPHTRALIVNCSFKAGSHLQGCFQKTHTRKPHPAGHGEGGANHRCRKFRPKLLERVFMKQMNRFLEYLCRFAQGITRILHDLSKQSSSLPSAASATEFCKALSVPSGVWRPFSQTEVVFLWMFPTLTATVTSL